MESNALLGLVYVLIGLSAESANKIKLKVTASYGYDYKFQCVEDDHRNSQSTLNNQQSLAQSPTSYYLTHFLRSILCVN